MGRNKGIKRPTSAQAPNPAKTPHSVTPPDEQIRFRFGKLDHHKWPLAAITKTHHQRLLKRLAAFEEMTVKQARENGALSDYDMADCKNRQAAQRLAQQYEGCDTLCCLRVAPGEAMRLMGIREGNQFHIIWWDPNHQVWAEGQQRK
jgi:hypothetical protein